MKVFVAGATGALGKPLVTQLVRRGHEVTGMTRSESKQDSLRELGARPAVADALDPDAVARAVAEADPDVIVHQLTAISGDEPAPHGARLRRHEPAADRGHRPPARRRARGGRQALRGAELRAVALRAHRRPGEERGGPARHDAAGAGPHDARGDQVPRAGGDGRRLDRGDRAPLRRLLRPRHVARPGPGGRADRDDPGAQVPRRRQGHRGLVLHPHRGCRGRHGRGGGARQARRLQHRGRRAGCRSPSGCPSSRRRSAPSRPVTCRSGSPGSSAERWQPS